MANRPPSRTVLLSASLALCVAFGLAASAGSAHASTNDYPTEARVDYVFACMASNGQTSDALRRCSCSIDHVAEKLTYEEYTEAETVIRMQKVPSGDDRMVMFRTAAWAKTMVDRLRRAQIEAEFECF